MVIESVYPNYKETGSENEDGNREYERTYMVEFSGRYSAAALVTNEHPDLPKRNDEHEDDTSVWVRFIEPELPDDESPNPEDGETSVALITFKYVQKKPSSINPLPESPIDEDPEIEWGGSEIIQGRETTWDGKPLLNSARQLYRNLPERPIPGGQVTISYYIEGNPADICVNYSYTTNADTWYGVAAGKAKFGKISAVKVYWQTQIFWKITYPINFNRDTWALKLIDSGTVELVDVPDIGLVQFDILDSDDKPITEPVLLNGAGAKQTTIDPETNRLQGVVYPTAGYALEQPTDWNVLNLPDPFAD